MLDSVHTATRRILLRVIFGLLLSLTLAGCSRIDYPTADACLEAKGRPLAVAAGYRIEKRDVFRSVTIYGLDRVVTQNLLHEAKDRFFVYSQNEALVREIGYHFEQLHDAKMHVGSTMFAKFLLAPTLEIIHYNSNGSFISAERITVDVAYFEEGTEGHLIRVRPQKTD